MKRTMAVAAVASLTLTLGACGISSQDAATTSATTAGASAHSAGSGRASTQTGFYDSSTVSSISVTVDQADYDEMLEIYADSGDKEWIKATVVIDGVTYEQVGLRLKGNSSLQGLSRALNAESGETAGRGGGGMGSDLSPDEPEGLPWRIKLDKYVDGQNHEGETDLVVRGNNTETALNEAVALELLDQAGLATQQASAARFSVNGSDEQLRLVVQNPDDQNWYEVNIDGNGVLFKAESGGDYSYRGEDYAAYTDAFDLEANPDDLSDADAYQPLIEFLDFVNNSDDETFAAELGDYLEIESFADYLAIEALLGNTDDIDGPGNNSYLAYDPDTGRFTVIAWDHNLALGTGMGGPGGGMRGGGQTPRGGQPGGEPPEGGDRTGAGRPGGGGGPGSVSNPLAQRFQENEEFATLIEAASTRLQAELIDSGFAAEALDTWTTVLQEQASDLVSTETIQSESDAVAQALSSASS